MINKLFTLGGLPVEEQTQEAKEAKRLPLNLQYFATKDDDQDDNDAGDDDSDDNDDDSDADDIPDLDTLLQNPKFKAAHEAKLQKQLSRRMKKFKDVDPDEYRKLKAQQKGDDNDDEGDKGGNDRKKDSAPDELAQRLARAELREKKALVKEFAVNNGVDSFLFSKFVDVNDIELNDEGEAENLDDILEELRDDARTAKYFAVMDDEESDEEDEPANKQYRPGTKQKMNKKKKVDPAELGRQKALARHQKKED